MDARASAARPPVILVASADEGVRRSLLVPLRRRYAEDYRIVEADGPASAVAAIDELAATDGQGVALVLADDATPVGGHDSVFAAARRAFPDVRRGPRHRVGILGRPGDGRRGPGAHDAGADRLLRGAAGALPRRVVPSSGHRLPPRVGGIGGQAPSRLHRDRRRRAAAHARAAQPPRPRRGAQRSPRPVFARCASMLAAAGVEYAGVPLVRTADGRVLVDPDDAELARAYGLETSLPDRVVDLAVVGAGPAGLASAVYAASEGLDTLVFEGESIGGQAGSSSLIRNYLGFSRGVSGAELAQRAYQQAWVFGARFAHTRTVTGMRVVDHGFELDVAGGEVVRARAVVLASGVTYRRLAAPGLQPFVGSSVFYGASSVEARAQSGRDVLVVGGGNSAGQAALHLARYARSVSLVVRGPSLAASMSRYLIDQLDAAGVGLVTRCEGRRRGRRRGRPTRPRRARAHGLGRARHGARRRRVRHDRRPPAHGMAGARGAARPVGFGDHGTRRAHRGRPAGVARRRRRADAARVLGARLLRGRRRATRIDQARRVGGRRGLGRDLRGARAPRRARGRLTPGRTSGTA